MTRETLRDLALELLAAPHEEPPSRVRELLSGAWRLMDEFECNGRRYFVATVVVNEVSLAQADVGLLCKRACGCSVKEIAIEAGVSEATISRRLQRAMRRLGLSGQPQLARVWAAFGLRGLSGRDLED
jgi:DNA-binding NarL/FixJ family response regulator